jgi:putative DNA methylase
MSDAPRLIEVAFPLKQASLDSVHEKNVRHGHISTLHIWPARRPLAACRAALIATLLPDPGDDEERKRILEKLGGKVVQKTRRKRGPGGRIEEQIVEETEGGILHWGRESGPDLDWFRQRIRAAYGGRAPRVLDPFAGGGAIPLEAMRLGCEATAADINPVAWFILKCTLEYPQKLAGQKRRLPDFVLEDRDFLEAFFKAQGLTGAALKTSLEQLGMETDLAPQLPGFETVADAVAASPSSAPSLDADLAWHVRAWGHWVLSQARRDLARFYPTYADFEPAVEVDHAWPRQPMRLVPLNADGAPDVDALNAEFDADYLADRHNPRWIARPAVAYLWARTVQCKNCRATLPLLKTRWLCKKDKKRVVLTMQPNADKTGVVFGIQADVPAVGNTPSQRREHGKRIGGGTMSRSGATCPCCGAIMTMQDIRLEGQAGRLGDLITAVVVDGLHGKEYRLPTEEEIRLAAEAEQELEAVYAEIPFGLPDEPTPAGGGSGAGRAFSVQGYGMMRWRDLFTPRQLLALGTFVRHTRAAREAMQAAGYPTEWVETVAAYLSLSFDRLAAFNCVNVRWKLDAEAVVDAFARFALPVLWDFAESIPVGSYAGAYELCYERIALALEVLLLIQLPEPPHVNINSAASANFKQDFDAVVTDPPYYDAIPYADAMDFFYVWLKRTLHSLLPEIEAAFHKPLSPKWDHQANDGELIDDASRFSGDKGQSKAAYEDGMFRSFQVCHRALKPDGRLVIVFAHKHPDAWETLVSAIIRAGFVVDGSWPIQTEMGNRTRALASAALSSSVWLVCKKRPESTRPGWDNRVLEEMRQNIAGRLRDFWDAGIRGPDFVWAATGPALEAYSRYPVVKKANRPGEVMPVSEFLKHVRRMVVDFVVGRVLSGDGDVEAIAGLDRVTTYYLLHRHDFGLADAPAGACILYAVSCGLSDRDLADRYDLLARSGGRPQEEDEEGDSQEEPGEGSGSAFRLKAWGQRRRPDMGYDSVLDSTPARPPLFPDLEAQAIPSREIPLIDQAHRLMHLWKAGEVVQVDEYLDLRGLRHSTLFHQLLQALIELAPTGGEERSLLESISNHIAGRGVSAPRLL